MSENSNSVGRPLLDRRALIAASPETRSKLCTVLQDWGASLLPFQAIEIRRLQDRAALDRTIASLEEYTWIIFTSSHGVCFFLQDLAERGIPKERLRGSKICAVGPATARAAFDKGLRVDLVPRDFVAEGVISALALQPGGLAALANRKILLPRAKAAREVLPLELVSAGAKVEVLPCYETVQAQVAPETIRLLLNNPPDLLVFTSSSNVTNFVSIVGHEKAVGMIRRAVVATLGPVTAGAVEGLGKKPEILPQENTVDSLLQAIRLYFASQ